MTLLLITPCTSRKDDTHPPRGRVTSPQDYLSPPSARALEERRKHVLSLPRARDSPPSQRSRETHAYDLYTHTGKAYAGFRRTHLHARAKRALLEGSGALDWFFLSGGYGVIHALEKATRYQATFNPHTARQQGIPYTTPYWRGLLPLLLDEIIERKNPTLTLVLGSRDYTQFILHTRAWRTRGNIKVFQSTGLSGLSWLSDILVEVLEAALDNNPQAIDRKYPGKLITQKPHHR